MGVDSSFPSSFDEVWHIAASTAFDESRRAEIEEANLIGTRNVLNFVKKRDVGKFFYMSTAYIAGLEKGVIPEGRVSHNSGFKNPYEETKYVCDQRVQDSGLPFIVIRPSIIIGDSRTGNPMGEERMFYGYALTKL